MSEISNLLGKGSLCGHGQSVLLIISLNTLVDVIVVPKNTYLRRIATF